MNHQYQLGYFYEVEDWLCRFDITKPIEYVPNVTFMFVSKALELPDGYIVNFKLDFESMEKLLEWQNTFEVENIQWKMHTFVKQKPPTSQNIELTLVSIEKI